MKHELKTDPSVFAMSWCESKTFEIRNNDRGFKIGDTLLLKETECTGEQIKEGAPLLYTGRELYRRVDYVLSGYGIKDGWVVMSVSKF